MLDKGQLIEIEKAAMRGKTFSSDVVLALMEIIAELEEQVSDLENQLTEVMERM